jgi:hypothetical protein
MTLMLMTLACCKRSVTSLAASRPQSAVTDGRSPFGVPKHLDGGRTRDQPAWRDGTGRLRFASIERMTRADALTFQ